MKKNLKKEAELMYIDSSASFVVVNILLIILKTLVLLNYIFNNIKWIVLRQP